MQYTLPSGLVYDTEKQVTSQNPFGLASLPEGEVFRDDRAGVGLEDKILQRVGNQILIAPRNSFTGDFSSLPVRTITGAVENDLRNSGGGFQQVSTIQARPGMANSAFLALASSSLGASNPVQPNIIPPVAPFQVPTVLPATAPTARLPAMRSTGSNMAIPAITPAAPMVQPIVSIPNPVQAPAATAMAISSVPSLYANSAIDALQKKIGDLSAKISAGLSSGGVSDIVSGLFEKFGVNKENLLVNDLDAQILNSQQILRKIPDDIKTKLQNVGISQGELDRLIVQETQKPLEVLRDLMEQRGAAQGRINQSMQFISLFSNVAMQDRAAKIEALKYDLETNKDLLKDLSGNQIGFLNQVIDNKKQTLGLVERLAENGAPQAVRESAMNLSPVEILANYGQYLAKSASVEDTGDIRNYEFAWQQGFRGSFTDFLREKSLFNNPLAGFLGMGGAGTPTSNPIVNTVLQNPETYKALPENIKTLINPTLAASGFDFARANLTPEQQERIASFGPPKEILRQIEESSKIINDQTTWFGALIKGGKTELQYQTKSSATALLLRDQGAKLLLLIRALGDKGVIPVELIARAEQNIPGFYDRKDIADAKIKSLRDLLNSAKSSYEQAYGIKGGNPAIGSQNSSPATVLMTGPDGIDYMVPATQVEPFIKAGGRRK